MILMEAFFGSHRFEDFQQHLGIARNILTVRLQKLCDNGILARIPIKPGAKRHEYKLTAMGRALYPALITITQWGDRWLGQPEGAPMCFVERATGEEIADVSIVSKQGHILKERDLALVAGPGASDETRERLQQLAARQQKVDDSKNNEET